MSAKCGTCVKTVYPMDPQISLDGCIFHKTCAKCADCNCQITISNFTKNGTTLLCKTHYFQRFRVEGSYLGGEKYSQKSSRENGGISPARSRSPAPAAVSPPPAVEDDPAPTMSVKDRMKKFGSTTTSKVPCGACSGNVFPNDGQITLDGIKFHKECAKCADCKCQITIANFTKSDKLLLCKIHYNERFSKEGSYVGGDKFAKKTTRNANSPVPPAASAPKPAEFTPVVEASVAIEPVPVPVVEEAAPAPAEDPPTSAEDPSPTSSEERIPASAEEHIPEEPIPASAEEPVTAPAEEPIPEEPISAPAEEPIPEEPISAPAEEPDQEPVSDVAADPAQSPMVESLAPSEEAAMAPEVLETPTEVSEVAEEPVTGTPTAVTPEGLEDSPIPAVEAQQDNEAESV